MARTLSKTALNPIASRTMFTAAVERAFHFTRPIHFVTRNLESTTATPGAGSLIVVNREGWALTCAHVVENLRKAVQVRAAFVAYRAELQAMGAPNKEARRELQKRHGLSKRTTSDAIVTMCGAGEGALSLNIITHGSLDLALVNFGRPIDLPEYPRFASDGAALRPGKFLCKFGYPFPNFTNFRINPELDALEWTNEGESQSAGFPLDGMVTRLGSAGQFEMSTPGLRGQSGGPVFDVDGVVWGMQAATSYYDLDYDIDQEVIREGEPVRHRWTPFLPVGVCLDVNTLRDFMRAHAIAFATT